MSSASPSSSTTIDVADSRAPAAPDWVARLVGGADAARTRVDGRVSQRTADGDGLRLVSVRVAGARELDGDGFHAAVRSAYGRLRAELERSATPHLIRVWNFIPGILEPLGDLDHRYMVFNAARHEAYEEWYGGRRSFEVRVATASGVGHDGPDLLVHGLASAAAGQPVENPRQVPSFRYSRRYGPLPPSFARATMTALGAARARTLLVGGTASVRGEETVFVDDLEQQLEETFRNLDALVDVALRRSGAASDSSPAERLGRFRHLRVYYRRERDREPVAEASAAAFGTADTVELARADLCRDELLVEIEGVADLTP